MGKQADKHDWNGQKMTIQEIAEFEHVSYPTAWGYIWNYGAIGSDDLPKGSSARRKQKPSQDLPDFTLTQNGIREDKPKASDILITIRPENPLHKMLNYLARRSSTNTDLAFCELMDYLREGHLFGEDIHEAIVQRLIERHSGTDTGEKWEAKQIKQAAVGWQKELIPYLERLEAENMGYAELRQKYDALLAKLRALTEE